MVDYAEDISYANSRLSHSYVLYNGELVYVDRVSMGHNGPIARIIYQNHGDAICVDLKLLQNSSFKLGMFYNKEFNSLGYASRVPKRQWKQGIRDDNLYDLINRCSIQPDYLRGELFRKYPELSTCLELVDNGEVSGYPFHSHYALGGKDIDGYRLIYRSFGRVGSIIEGDASFRFNLDDKFEWLQEDVNEVWKYV